MSACRRQVTKGLIVLVSACISFRRNVHTGELINTNSHSYHMSLGFHSYHMSLGFQSEVSLDKDQGLKRPVQSKNLKLMLNISHRGQSSQCHGGCLGSTLQRSWCFWRFVITSSSLLAAAAVMGRHPKTLHDIRRLKSNNCDQETGIEKWDWKYSHVSREKWASPKSVFALLCQVLRIDEVGVFSPLIGKRGEKR